jgi:hypothetical protein
MLEEVSWTNFIYHDDIGMEELDIAQELLSTVDVPTDIRTVHLLKSSQKLCSLSQLV